MADQRLTDKPEVTSLGGADIMEFVLPGDSTDNPAGSTRKGTVNTLKNTIVGATTTGNAILRGGIIHISGLTYYVWADSYIINSQVYNIPVNSTVTLSDGDATHARIDVFLVRVQTINLPVTASIVVLEGTPAASPVKPTVDLTDEVEVSFRTIAATETTDPTTVTELIYDENTGEAAEWDNTTNVTGGNLADTTDPYLNTLNFTAPATTDDTVSWTNATTSTFDSNARLNFALKIPGGINSGSGIPRIQIKLINSSTSEFWLITLNAGNLSNHGFSITNLGWQLTQVNFSDLAASTFGQSEYDRIEFRLLNMPIMELDWITIQSDITQPADPTTGLYKTIPFSLTNAQLKSTTAIDLIPAAGAGTQIDVASIVLRLNYNTAVFNYAVPLLFYGDGTATSPSFQAKAVDLNRGATTTYRLRMDVNSSFDPRIEENTPFRCRVSSAPASGDGTVDGWITYQVVNLNTV